MERQRRKLTRDLVVEEEEEEKGELERDVILRQLGSEWRRRDAEKECRD